MVSFLLVPLCAIGLATAEPVARAGRTFLAYPEETIRLDGSASEGTGLEYRWVQVGGPPVALKGGDSARPSFSPKLPGRYTFELTVREGETASAPDEVDTVVLDPDLGTRYIDGSGCSHAPGSPWSPLLPGVVGLVLLAARRRAANGPSQ